MNRKNQQIFKIQKHQMSKVISEVDFPSWLQGPWQHITVLKNQLVFRDQSSFKSYRMKLVNQFSDDKFIVLSRSQCGEESFKCLWIRKLDANIIEFQTSSEYVEKLTNFMLCNDEHFDNSRWLTFSSKISSFSIMLSYRENFVCRSGKRCVENSLSNRWKVYWNPSRRLGALFSHVINM